MGHAARRIGLGLMLAGAGSLMGIARPLAYSVITRDGHRIEAVAKPEVKGLQAFMRLAPRGNLAVIQEEQIDWARTEAANPRPGVIAVPSGATLAEGAPAPEQPIELKILGGSAGRQAAGSASQEQITDPHQPATPAQPADIHAQDAILALQKEYGKISVLRDQALEERKLHETEVAKLRENQVSPASEDGPASRRMQELQRLIDDLSDRVSKLETRLDDIRNEVVQHGGTIP